MIKVVHLQIFPESTGRAALRLHKAFLETGIDSTLISLKRGIDEGEKIKQKGRIPTVISWIDSKLQSYLYRKNIPEFGFFFYPILGSDVSGMKEVRNADYIYVHWVLGGFLNLSNFEQLAKLGKPVIFFMHDMWTITGGCHHSFTCEKYKSGCYNCQVFPENKKNDLSAKGFKEKLKLYSKYNNLYFISPSKWLYDCAKQSELTKSKPIFHIPNLIDNKFFKSFDKNIAKQILNIDASQFVIAFGAVSVDNPYKGWPYLQKALKILQQGENIKNVTILIFGSGYKKEIEDAIPFETKFVGHLNDEYSTMLVYNAADVFVAPSLADNLPTTVLESLSCGTPVVGFNVGGIPDMVRHKENGYLARYKDANDISEGIKFCIENKIKGFNLPDFEPASILKKHFDLFKYLQSIK